MLSSTVAPTPIDLNENKKETLISVDSGGEARRRERSVKSATIVRVFPDTTFKLKPSAFLSDDRLNAIHLVYFKVTSSITSILRH